MTDEFEAIAEWAKGNSPDLPDKKEESQDTALTFDELREQVDRLQSELNQHKLSEQLSAIARELKIPEAIIEHDLALFAGRFILKEGKPVSANDTKKSAKDVLAELQKNRPHWQPITRGAGTEPMDKTSDVNWFTKSTF
jgi:hypothetical protein